MDFKFDLTMIFIIISLIEIIGQKLLINSFFNFGIPFSKSSINKKVNVNFEINKIITKKEGKYKFISHSKCIFTSRLHFFSFFRIDSFMPTKNICYIKNNNYEVISKLPIGMTFLMIYTTVILFFEYLFKVEALKLDFDLLFPFIFLLFFVIMYFIEHNRVAIMKKELNEILDV